MSSLADKIAKALDPTPTFVDPEDEVNFETKACISENFDEDGEFPMHPSVLRRGNAPLLSDVDARYAGKKISRKSLEDFDQFGENTAETDSEIESEVCEEDINMFKKQLPKDIDSSYSNADNDEDVSDDADSSVEEDDNGNEDDADGDNAEGESLTEKSSASESENDEMSECDMIQQFSNIDVQEEMEKAKAVKAQQGLWNRFCASRIRLQKVIGAANRFPQFDVWKDFENNMDENCKDAHKKAMGSLDDLLNLLMEVQSRLILNNSETRKLFGAIYSPLEEKGSDEEIPSGTESEHEDNEIKSKIDPSISSAKNMKRKLTFDEYDDILAKRHKAFIPYRNTVIQKWDDRTRLSTGKSTQKSFSAFDQPVLRQIDLILEDKQRLIKRTQLKRSVYHILGKPEKVKSMVDDSESMNALPKRDEHLKEYDPEIFDDEDFYRPFLKDVIESRACGIDPAVLSKHLEIQKLRSKAKKIVDTKASKARKTRYDVHSKLVSVLASINNSTLTNETRDELCTSLFGTRRKVESSNN